MMRTQAAVSSGTEQYRQRAFHTYVDEATDGAHVSGLFAKEERDRVGVGQLAADAAAQQNRAGIGSKENPREASWHFVDVLER